MNIRPRSNSRELIVFIALAVVAGGFMAGVFALGSQSFEILPPKEFVREVSISEDVQIDVQESLRESLIRGIETFDLDLVETALTGDFEGRFPDRESGRLIEDD